MPPKVSEVGADGRVQFADVRYGSVQLLTEEGVVRRLIALLLIAGILPGSASAFQARGAAGSPAVKACPVLTRDLVEPFAANKKALDILPPEEEAMSNGAAACEWGVVRLQLWPPNSGMARTAPGKEYQSLPGVGELAYFRSNRDRYAELMVWSATRFFTLQVAVPSGGTAESIKPQVVTLAKQVLAKLQ